MYAYEETGTSKSDPLVRIQQQCYSMSNCVGAGAFFFFFFVFSLGLPAAAAAAIAASSVGSPIIVVLADNCSEESSTCCI